MRPFEIRVDETFPALRQAPVIEAVLEVRGRAEVAWKEDVITGEFQRRLPEYPVVESMRGMMTEMRLEPGSALASRSEDLGWLGLVMLPEDRRAAVQFQRDTFVFSKLAPYPGWDDFVGEGKRLFAVHREVARPLEMARIGLRFINRIPIQGSAVKIEDYLVAAPREPEGLVLPYSGFLHRDTFSVPGHEYGVQITRTIQPQVVGAGAGGAQFDLILDVDVVSTLPWSGSDSELTHRLSEMRWLKNKAFFGSLTEQAKTLLT
jgi:uncharacterized protein (TIGR04255 family)